MKHKKYPANNPKIMCDWKKRCNNVLLSEKKPDSYNLIFLDLLNKRILFEVILQTVKRFDRKKIHFLSVGPALLCLPNSCAIMLMNLCLLVFVWKDNFLLLEYCSKQFQKKETKNR